MVWTATHRSSMDLKWFCSCFCRITGYIQKLGTNGRPTSNYTKTSSTMCLNFAHHCFNQVVQWPQNTFGNKRDEIPGMEGKGLDSELPKAAHNQLAIQFVATLTFRTDSMLQPCHCKIWSLTILPSLYKIEMPWADFSMSFLSFSGSQAANVPFQLLPNQKTDDQHCLRPQNLNPTWSEIVGPIPRNLERSK